MRESEKGSLTIYLAFWAIDLVTNVVRNTFHINRDQNWTRGACVPDVST